MVTIEMDNFDLQQICDSGQCFRMKKSGENRFTVIAGDKYLEVIQEGSIVNFDCREEDFILFWIPYFDLDTDYGAYISKINPRDKYLCTAAEAGSGIRILRQDLWEIIVSFLISQQNNIVRIRRCIENLCETYGTEKTAFNGKKYHAFPTPVQLCEATEEELRACNLGYRARYVLQAARSAASGELPLERLVRMKYYKRARKSLMGIYGIGEKVADCICLFALHHLSAFPVDTHIRQALDAHYKKGFPNRRYWKVRGVMQQYIFYYELLSSRGKV